MYWQLAGTMTKKKKKKERKKEKKRIKKEKKRERKRERKRKKEKPLHSHVYPNGKPVVAAVREKTCAVF